MLTRIKQGIRNHPLIDLFYTANQNPKVCILIEPLWGIPYNLIAPFSTLYMYALGVTDIQIGLILSIAMMVQLVFSFLGGVLTDKLGRKRTTMLGDFWGWTIPCIIWAVSQNFWFFLIAVVMNSFEQINQTAWYCLLIEDADKRQTVNIFTLISIAGLLSVFFAPISGQLIDQFSLVPVIRVLYLIFSAAMIVKGIITWRFTTETRQGLIRKEETKHTSITKMLLEYKEIVPQIFKNKSTVQTLCIVVILQISSMISTNFFGLYVGDTLGIPEKFLAYFPIIKAIVMILFMVFFQHRIRTIRIPITVGFVIYIIAQFCLIISKAAGLPTILLYILLDSVAHALVYPRKDTLVVQNVDPEERARIVALMTAMTILFTSPFGYLTGFLSSMDRRLPFILAAVLFGSAIFFISRMQLKNQDSGETEPST